MPDIKTLNNNLRKTLIGGRVVLTQGINVKMPKDIARILAKVRNFNNFTKANDPYGEHETSLSFAREGRPKQRLVVRANRKR